MYIHMYTHNLMNFLLINLLIDWLIHSLWRLKSLLFTYYALIYLLFN